VSKRQRDRRAKRLRHGVGRIGIGTGAALGAALVAPAVGQANNFPVTSNADAGPNTLRQAITDANAHAGADTISFSSVTGTIALQSSLPTVTDGLTITGPGASTLTLDGSGIPNGSIMRATPAAASDPAVPLTVSDLTFTSGSVSGTKTYGGAIGTYNADLTVERSVFTHNQADFGGAIGSIYGSLSVANSEFSDNAASANGGAAYALSTSGADFSRSTVTGNSASLGGGVSTWLSPASITESTISGNHSDSTGGGLDLGAYGYYDVYPSTVTNSTVTGNTASALGGGIYSYGGALYYAPTSGQLNVRSSTIAGNSATGGGGGIAAAGQSYDYAPVLQNSIVGCNSTEALSGADLNTGTGETPFAASFSLIQNAPSSAFTETVSGSNVVGQNPQLAALADNGGPTQTRALAPNSPVIDKGSTSLAKDQRGEDRGIDQPPPESTATGADGSDMGAFEVQDADPLPTAAACDSHVGTAPVTTPPATTPSPVVPQSQTLTFGNVSVRGVKRRKNGVSFAITCTIARCNGKAVLDTVERLNGRKLLGLQKRAHRKRVKVGSKSYSLTAGQTRTVTVKLNGKGRKLLRKFRILPVTLVVSQKQAAKNKVVRTARVRIKAPRRHR
jgi:hypothetical protein